ncbi:esterase-like activity of phytase family protein, partial [Chloroflexota bacterium]
RIQGSRRRLLVDSVLPDKFLPDGAETYGIRDNLAFESLTASPDRRYLYTAVENALVQDGPKSSLTEESPSRVLQYKMSPGRPQAEFVYVTSRIPKEPLPPGDWADNGLVELVALDNVGTFLALERSYAEEVGNTIVLFETSTRGATDVSGFDALPGTFTAMSKEELVDLDEFNGEGLDPDNVEGMTFGPKLADGRQTLILVSDNNFNPYQETQFIALALEIEDADTE